MATPQAITLIHALKNIRTINSKLAATDGAMTVSVCSHADSIIIIQSRSSLTLQLFSSPSIQDTNLDNTRAAIGFEFQSFVQNIRSVKTTDSIAKAYPGMHYNMKYHIARRNWLAHEYETTSPLKWAEIAKSIYNDLPTNESAIIDALKALGVPQQ